MPTAKRLSVAAALVDDELTVAMEKSTMQAMGIAHGDVVLLAQGGRKTVALARLDESDEAQSSVARISTLMRRNLHLSIDDDVTVTGLGSDVPTGKFIRVLPIDDTIDEAMTGEKLFENYLQPYFADAFRPVQQGDLFLIPNRKGAVDVEFVVVEIDPKPYCIVGPKTDIIYNGAPVPRQDDGGFKLPEFKGMATPIGSNQRASADDEAARKVRIRAAFDMFDKEKKGSVIQEEVSTIMRYLGAYPTEKDIIKKILPEMQEDEPSTFVTYDRFEKKMLEVLYTNEYEPDTDETLLAAFRVIDTDKKGYIEAEVMRELLTTKGTPFREKEMEGFLAAAKDPPTGRIYYEDFIAVLIQALDPKKL